MHTMTNHAFVERVIVTFTPHQNAEQAQPMAAYMKDQFPFLGIQTPQRQALTKQLMKEIGIPHRDDLPTIIHQLWDLPEREYHYFALSILHKVAKHFEQDDIILLESLITRKSWWDTVDDIAKHLVGAYLLQYPERMEDLQERWLTSGNLWLRRTVILCQLGWKQRTNEDMLFSATERSIDSKEFFIRKAIGWALREYSKTNAESVIAFVASHPDLSGLSVREAMKDIERQRKKAAAT